MNPRERLLGIKTAGYSYLANSSLVGQILLQSNGVTAMSTVRSYDYLNRLLSVSNTPADSHGYSYNAANQRTAVAEADGSYWNYGYDSLGQVTNGVRKWRDNTLVAGQQFGYAFDTIGNRLSTANGGDASGNNLRAATYANNALNQITSRSVPGYLDIQGVSLATNTVTVNGTTAYRKWEYFRSELAVANGTGSVWQSVTVAATGQSTVTGNLFLPQTPETFSYDADGNTLSDGRWNYIWDGENRLVQMTVNTTAGPQYTLTFAYDSKGRRIQKLVSTNGVAIYTNRFLYDGWNLVAELNPDNSTVRTYLWGNDLSGSMQGAGGVGGLLAEHLKLNTTNFSAFPMYDGNGNITGLTGNNGVSLAQYEYGPFGELIRKSGPFAAACPFRFSTKYQDDESDLDYYGYRYYTASTGRWLGRDPMQEKDGAALYVTLKNNLQTTTDYLGLWKQVNGCDDDREKILIRNEKYAQLILIDMKKQMEDKIGTLTKFQAAYPTLFNTTAAGQSAGFDPSSFYLTYFTKMDNGMQKIIDKIGGNTVSAICCCSSCPFCTTSKDKDVLAFTHYEADKISFCEPYFSEGTTAQVGAIVHEYSHLVLNTKDEQPPELYPLQWPNWPDWSYYWGDTIEKGVPAQLEHSFGKFMTDVTRAYGYIQ